jgi:hypothetical protein
MEQSRQAAFVLTACWDKGFVRFFSKYGLTRFVYPE